MRDRPVIPPEHWPRLIEAAAAGKPAVQAQRDAAAVALVSVCGLRLSELCAATVDDVDLEAAEMRVGTRVLAVPAKAWGPLEAYLDVRPEADTETLFVSRHGRGLSHRQARRIVEHAAYEAGLDHAYPRLLRRSCARALLDRGATPRQVKRRLGHVRRCQALLCAGVAE